ncbi:hypothetical protein ABXJ56_11680 [Microbacterium chocolatum]|uniref:hypothetical protein n=1 Tax=Microbacterium aurantiacum TaxID=162393 RepID=UPI00338E3AD5
MATAVTVGVVAVLLAGCASEDVPTPVASESSADQPSAESSGSPVGDIRPFGGSCAEALTAAEVSDVLATPMQSAVAPWESGYWHSLGGLECSWITSETHLGAMVQMWAFPADAGEAVGAPAGADCVDLGVSRECTLDELRGHLRLLWKAAGPSETLSVAVVRALSDRAAEHADTFPAPEVPGIADPWWSGQSCAELMEGLRAAFPDTVGVEEEILVATEGTPRHLDEWRAIGGNLTCDLRVTDGEREPMVVTVRGVTGGAAFFPSAAASEGAQSVTVDGAAAAVFVRGEGTAYDGAPNDLVVSDGAHTLILTGNGVDPLETLIRTAGGLLRAAR